MPPDSWRPVGIDSLEPAALEAATSSQNQYVVAGPGAGKTELLAQRTCYLLQTGACPLPKRVLAISFKKNSARALAERVELRCGPALARYFDSLTFDQFAKSLVDRFNKGIPLAFRPTSDYEIIAMSDRDWESIMQALPGPVAAQQRAERASVGRAKFRQEFVYGAPLLADRSPEDYLTQLAYRCWSQMLRRPQKSALDFPMIERLAELIVRSNPAIKRALRMTYSHVLLDEFQDTTHVQFDLVSSVFEGSGAVLTAVGDQKQRIMGFAMALPNAFSRFESVFRARRRDLLYNYRSAPELVAIQHHLALALDPSSIEAEAKSPLIGTGHSAILDFPSEEHEAAGIGHLVGELISRAGLQPADICILVKQRVVDFGGMLGPRLSARGVKLLYDPDHMALLDEPLVRIAMPFLRLAMSCGSAGDWTEAIRLASDIRSASDDADEQSALGDDLATALAVMRGSDLSNDAGVVALVKAVTGFIGEEDICAYVPEYGRQLEYREAESKFIRVLATCIRLATTVEEGLRDFSGSNCIQMMTVHRSKGLEFDTMIFVGLEDSSWWAYASEPNADTSAFFVAFSRAKRRALFTFCASRQSRHGNQLQTRNAIAPLYTSLRETGVPTFALDGVDSMNSVLDLISPLSA